MKKIMLSIILSVSFLIGHVSMVSADNVAVQGNLVLTADRGLTLGYVYEDLPETCELLVNGAPIEPGTFDDATDVVIDGDFAVVTNRPADLPIETVVVDVSSCLAVSEEIDPLACVSTANVEEGELIIPCVEIDGQTFAVEMERRGNSDNWEVSFFGDSPVFSHRHDDDDEDDDDVVVEEVVEEVVE